MLGVVFNAQPAHVERARVVIVVRLDAGAAADFAGLFLQ
jgi:hypothetical protein